MTDEEIIYLVNSRVENNYAFEKKDKKDNFFYANSHKNFDNMIWVCPYYLKLKYKNHIINNPLKQLKNIKKFFFKEFPEFNNQLVGWTIAYNSISNLENELDIKLSKITYDENYLKLY